MSDTQTSESRRSFLVDILGASLTPEQHEALVAAGITHVATDPAPFIAEQVELSARDVDEAHRVVSDILGAREYRWWQRVTPTL